MYHAISIANINVDSETACAERKFVNLHDQPIRGPVVSAAAEREFSE
jgi:hypothetical protein